MEPSEVIDSVMFSFDRIGALYPTRTFLVKSKITDPSVSPIYLKITILSRAYNNKNGVFTVSLLSRTMPDTPLLSATELRNIYTICDFMYHDEDESKFNSTRTSCDEQVMNHENRTLKEQVSLTTRCLSVEFGVVDNETGKVNKQRLRELVNKDVYAIGGDAEKKLFLEKVVETCGFWECLEKPCQNFTISIPSQS